VATLAFVTYVREAMADSTPHLSPSIGGLDSGPTLLFVQGWPDDLSMWDSLVAALRDRYRCVRVNMPNYPGAEYRRWGYDHEQMAEGLAQCVREISRGKPITLIAHDWGAVWSYRMHLRHPELVSRFVALDIGPDVKPNATEAAIIVAYQFWLATAFVIGGGAGDWMTRRMARLARSPLQGAAVHAGMNYPYLHTWKELLSGKAPSFAGYAPEIPLMLIYGGKKPARFHTERWADFVRSRPDNAVIELPNATHWVTLDPKLNSFVAGFLDRTNASIG
jgi:pimeloyl-ACP methyl ester carboxylesterase